MDSPFRLLEDFRDKFAEFFPRLLEHFPPPGGNGVIFPDLSADNLGPALEVPLFFHGMQHRVDRARTQTVAVAGKLFNDPQTVNRLEACMMKDVDPDESGGKIFFH